VLLIRKEQMDALANHRRTEFRKRLIAHLTSVLSAKGIAIDVPALAMTVDRGIADAPRFGLTTEKHVALFIEITCLHLGGFPPGTHPKQALAILSSYGMDPERKLDRYRQWAQSMKRREGRE
jgi:hypothetical protein